MSLRTSIELRLASLTRHDRFRPKLEVTRITLRVPGLPEALEGFCIGHISDLHVGLGDWLPFHVDEAAKAVRAENPDVLVNTGDYLMGNPPIKDVITVAEKFLFHKDPSASGSSNIAILGNHDFYAGDDVAQDLAGALETLGVTLLSNGSTQISRGGSRVSFVGLSGNLPGFERAVEELMCLPRPRIALVHEPDLIERLPRESADLVLAGHSHGGQIALPGITAWTVQRQNGSRYVGGMYRVNDMPMYVSRGLGNTGLPIRFRASPELTFIRLAH